MYTLEFTYISRASWALKFIPGPIPSLENSPYSGGTGNQEQHNGELQLGRVNSQAEDPQNSNRRRVF